MKFLADVNVIFPLLLSQHQHLDSARAWYDSTARGDVVLCRVVKLGVLRLLSNKKVLGHDILQPADAMDILEKFATDERIVLVSEPDGLDVAMKRLLVRSSATPNLWTDAYLGAFATVAKLQLVTFDRGFLKFAGLDAVLLGR